MCYRVAPKSKKMDWSLRKGEPAFMSKGLCNWTDATVLLKNHESLLCHKEAMQLVVTLPATCPDVGEMLSREMADQTRDNRECLL